MPLGIGRRFPRELMRLETALTSTLVSSFFSLPMVLANLFRGHLTLAATGFQNVDGYVGQDAREALALGVHQRLDAVRGTFTDQNDAGAANGHEHSVLGARVDGNRLILGHPTAAERTKRCAGSARLVLDLREGGFLSSAGKNKDGG